MREIEYRPQNIRETLVELKDSAELAVDLAYSAVLFDNDELAGEVVDLEARANFLQYHARIALMLATKTTTDAERLVGIFQVVDSAVAITEAAGDIARIVLRGFGIPPASRAQSEADERFVRAVVTSSSPLAGRRLADLELDLDESVNLIAIRRDVEWVFDPMGDDQLLAGDVLFGRGPAAGVADIYEQATGEPYPDPELPGDGDEVDRAIETVVELKNVSELAVGLAYGAALYDSDAMAGEVQVLEQHSDELREELEGWLFDAAADAPTEQLRGLAHLAVAGEVICDAALDIAEVVFREVELHPVFAQAIQESRAVVTSVTVPADGALARETIGTIELEETGLVVLALERDGDWTYDPGLDTTLQPDDTLVVIGPQRGAERLRQLAGEP